MSAQAKHACYSMKWSPRQHEHDGKIRHSATVGDALVTVRVQHVKDRRMMGCARLCRALSDQAQHNSRRNC